MNLTHAPNGDSSGSKSVTQLEGTPPYRSTTSLGLLRRTSHGQKNRCNSSPTLPALAELVKRAPADGGRLE
jgi:hypothetical protein